MVAKLQQNSTIKVCIKTNNLIPNSTNLSQRQHCLPVNFNNFIFSSTIFSQHQLHKLLNFNIVISLKINGKKSTQKKFLCCWINTCSYPIFNYLKMRVLECQPFFQKIEKRKCTSIFNFQFPKRRKLKLNIKFQFPILKRNENFQFSQKMKIEIRMPIFIF